MSEPAHSAAPDTAMRLSVVVPCFNEESVLPELHRRLGAVFQEAPAVELELICVDDGSRDGTLALLRDMQRDDPRLRVLSLSRNFGQLAATTAGLTEATGDAVAIIDADMQDPPEVIMEMLARWRDGVEVAYGVRTMRDGETASKRWTAKLFSRLINRLSEVSIPLDVGDFCLLDHKVVEAFLAMPERDRYHRGMIAWAGFRQEAVPFHRSARAAGETKYTSLMLCRLALNAVLSFSLTPLRLALWTGCVVATAALGVVGYGLFSRLFAAEPMAGWQLAFAATVFLAGIQLVFIGILGEYLGRVYGEVKRRPLFLVKERLGFPDASDHVPHQPEGRVRPH